MDQPKDESQHSAAPEESSTENARQQSAAGDNNSCDVAAASDVVDGTVDDGCEVCADDADACACEDNVHGGDEDDDVDADDDDGDDGDDSDEESDDSELARDMDVMRRLFAGGATVRYPDGLGGPVDSDDDSDDDDDDDGLGQAVADAAASAASAATDDDDEDDGKPASCIDDPRCPAATRWSAPWDLRRRELGLSRGHAVRERGMASFELARRLRRERTLEFHGGCVNTLHYSEDGEKLASSGDDLRAAIWDWRRGCTTLTFPTGHTSNVFQAKFMPSSLNSVMITSARDGKVRRHHLCPSGGEVTSRTVAMHEEAAHKIAMETGNPHSFLSCGEEGFVYDIDLRKDEPNHLLTCRDLTQRDDSIRLFSVFINPVQPWYFAVSGSSKTLRVYDRRFVDNDQPVQLYTVKNMRREYASLSVTCVVYSHDGKELLATYNDESIYVFNTELSRTSPVHRYKGHRNSDTIKGVNFFGPNSEYIVSGSDCGHVFLWEKSTEKIVQLLEADQMGAVNCLEPNPQCFALATSGLENDVKIWSPTAKEPTDLSEVDDLTRRNTSSFQNSSASWLVNVLMEHRIRSLMSHRRARGVRRADDEDSDEEEEEESDDGAAHEPEINCAQA